MRNHDADVRRYLREIRRELPCTGKSKRRILKQILEMTELFAEDHPEVDYLQIVARFGTPQQIAESYVDEMETREITKNLRIRRKIIGIISIVAVAIVAIWIGVVSAAMIGHNNEMDGYAVITDTEIERIIYDEGESKE